MDYAKAKVPAACLKGLTDRASAALRAFPKGPMGLTTDAVRATLEWRSAKLSFDAAFANEREFNGKFVKAFAKEIRAERRERAASYAA